MPDRKPTDAERKILEKEMERARKARDKAVTNKRSGPATHMPTPRNSRKDILDNLT